MKNQRLGLGLRIDYILAPVEFSILQFDTLQNVYFSDHRPIIATLRNRTLNSELPPQMALNQFSDQFTESTPVEMLDTLFNKLSLLMDDSPISRDELNFTANDCTIFLEKLESPKLTLNANLDSAHITEVGVYYSHLTYDNVSVNYKDDSPRVRVTLGSLTHNALIDSGSTLCLVGLNEVQNHVKNFTERLTKAPGKVTLGDNSSTIVMLGHITLPLLLSSYPDFNKSVQVQQRI